MSETSTLIGYEGRKLRDPGSNVGRRPSARSIPRHSGPLDGQRQHRFDKASFGFNFHWPAAEFPKTRLEITHN